jgi:hypothetical protein
MIATILIALSGILNALMDHLQFRIHPDHPWDENQFMNPVLSWMNKYKGGDPDNGEAFPGSTTILVGFTDGWHHFKMWMWICVIGAVILYPDPDVFFVDWPIWIETPIMFMSMYIVRAMSFHLSFHHIFTASNIRIMQKFTKSFASFFRAVFSAFPFWVSYPDNGYALDCPHRHFAAWRGCDLCRHRFRYRVLALCRCVRHLTACQCKPEE